jgi:membrane-associated phospholipid phosphatase
MSPLDRRVLGNYSPAAHRAADLVIAGLIVVPPSVALVANGLGDGRAFFENLALSVETVVLTQGLTQLTKAAVDRYAPIVYDERVPLEERMSKDALGSFWSGHTATAFATATSFVVSYWIRHPRDPWRWVILATLESAALSVGLLKMRAGYHYPSDVAAGALVGTSLGVLVPTLHTRF